jgi:YVTN family beta-propeller protein
VTNQFARGVGVIDIRLHRQVEVIPVAGDPFRVAVGQEGQRLYVTTNVGAVLQIEPETRRVVWSVQLGGNLNGLAVNPAGERIYVGNVGGTLYELNPTGEVTRELRLAGKPQGLALSSDGKELYAAAESGDFVVIDLESWSETARIPLGTGGFGIAVTPDQSQVWVTAPATGEVFVIDRQSRGIVRTIAVGGTPRRIAFDRSGATAAIANEAGTIDMVR